MPWIDLEGAVNVRDLGGLPTQDGNETVAGRLLRADNLQELSPSDIRRLVRDIGVTTVVDLRSSAEVASEGPAPLDTVPGVRHAHHPVIPELGSATDAVAEALLLKRDQDRSRFPSDPTAGTTWAIWKTGRTRWSARCGASRATTARPWSIARRARTGRAWW